MEGSEANAEGNEEVEGQDEGVTVRVALEVGVANLTWDPQDPFLKFNNKNSSTTQTPVAASTPMLMPAEENMPGLKGPDLEEPWQRNPESRALQQMIPDQCQSESSSQTIQTYLWLDLVDQSYTR